MIASERDILELLHQRYSKTYSGARRFAVAEHVSNMQNRIADFIAVDSWPVSDFALHGHEIKVSRGDWLAELRQPDKSEAFKRYMDYWWLVVPDRDIVKPGELPAGWGLLAPGRRGGASYARASVPHAYSPIPFPKVFSADLAERSPKQLRIVRA